MAARFNRHAIGVRLFAAVLVFSLCLTLGIAGIQLPLQERQARRTLATNFAIIRDSHVPGINANLWVLDIPQLQVQLDSLITIEGIDLAAIVVKGKEILVAGQPAGKRHVVRDFSLEHSPSGVGATYLGILRVYGDLQPILRHIHQEQLGSLLYRVGEIFFISLFLFLIFQWLVTRHLTNIAAHLATLEPRQPVRPLTLSRRRRPAGAGDELDMVVQAINSMQSNLQRLFQDLETELDRRRETEQWLRVSKESWDKTFNALDDIVTILDDQLRIVRVNDAACKLLGNAHDELIGSFCHMLFRGNAAPCTDCPVTQTIADRKPHSAEITHQQLGKTYLVTATPILDEEERLKHIVHFARDITANRKLETNLRQAQKMEAIGTLAGGVAHDFNNILTPILGYTELAMQQLSEASLGYGYLGHVLKGAYRAKDLARQILTFSRAAEQELKAMNVALVIKEALKLLRSSIPTTIEIRQNIHTDCGVVLADPTQIHQMLMNLCTNAYHAMRETGGVLAVALTPTEVRPEDTKADLPAGKYVCLEVADTGCGMDKRTLERIFEPYFTTKGTGEGTGLGLSIVHGIVTSLHGHLSVYSEPGKGSSFRIRLPLVEAPIAGVNTLAAKLPGGSERIMIVDDEEIIAQFHKTVLESLGYRVMAQTDSTEAWRTIETDPAGFDLVVTDMTMPRMTGAELTQRALSLRPNLRIIICTGFSELINEEKARAMGIRSYLMKPVLASELAHSVRMVLDEKVHKDPTC